MTEKKKHIKQESELIKSSEAKPEEVVEGEAIEIPEGEEEAKTVTVPLKDYAEQLKELDEWKKQSKEFMDGWQHERADFSNYRKRIERDQTETKQNITADVVKKYLVVLDDIQRALKTRPTEGEAGSWAEGVELIARKLQSILDSEGIKRIPAEDELFDPHRHEAVTHEDSPDHQNGQIIEVLQEGYTIGERVIRPALVRVAK
jgi:molecular chaperone GrpE